MPRDLPGVTRARPNAIAVFGSSEPGPGSADYERAREVGRLLAEAGFAVVNGGYGGIMEASARGAREAGGRTIGITTRAFTSRPGANPWIEIEESAADLHERTRRLFDNAAGFVILPGRSGTLSELTFLWALAKADLLGSRPIVLLGEVWKRLIPALRELDLVDESALDRSTLVATPAEAIAVIGRRLASLATGDGGTDSGGGT